MKPAPFAYAAPESVAEAVGLLTDHGDDAKVLAGGQSLLAMMNLRVAQPEVLVDVRRCGLAGIDVTPDTVRIGSMTTQNAALADPAVVARLPLLHRALGFVSHHSLRNRGTIGGSAAHADPAAEIPTAMVALDAVAEIVGPDGPRLVDAGEFFVSHFTSALEVEDVLVALRFPADRWDAWGFDEIARRQGDFALAGAAVGLRLDADGERIAEARIVLAGGNERPTRATAAEAELVGQRIDDDAVIATASRATAAVVDAAGDLHGSTEYRRRITPVVVRRALRQAADRTIERRTGSA